MAGSLVHNAANYIANLPILLFRQYANVASIPSEWIALGVAGPILVLAARIRTPFYARALGFFVLVFLTTVASAAMIHAADGQRTLIVTNLLLSLGLALGFALPGAPRPPAPRDAGTAQSIHDSRVLLLVFGLPALVKAKVIHRMASADYAGDSLRIAAPPLTPAVLVLPGESPANRARWSSHPNFFDRSAIA